MAKSVFEFTDHVSFLKHVQGDFPGRKRPIPSALWAKRLGYRSPRSLEMVLRGTRVPSQEMTRQIAEDLSFTSAEFRYFDTLVAIARGQSRGKDVHDLKRALHRLRPIQFNRVVVANDFFRLISDWYFLVLRQMAKAPDFGDLAQDPRKIQKRLRGKVSVEQVEEALDLLVQLGIFEHDPVTGKLRNSNGKAIFTTDDIPSKAVRQHHSQMMDRAKEALEEQPVLQRELISTTLRMDPRRIPEMKKAIREACDRINAEFSAENGSSEGSSVFQLNAQFFEHTLIDS